MTIHIVDPTQATSDISCPSAADWVMYAYCGPATSSHEQVSVTISNILINATANCKCLFMLTLYHTPRRLSSTTYLFSLQ